MSRHEVEDGMGFAGQVPTAAEQREERLRAEIARLRARLAEIKTIVSTVKNGDRVYDWLSRIEQIAGESSVMPSQP